MAIQIKKAAVLAMAFLIMMPFTVLTGKRVSFGSGAGETVVALESPSFNGVVNLTVPAGLFVSNVTMLVAGMAAQYDSSAYPEEVALSINGTTIWGFRGDSLGAVGKQEKFLNGIKSAEFTFDEKGGSSGTHIRLPKGAVVERAVMEIWSGPRLAMRELINFTGSSENDNLGHSVSGAGDVNGDGYDDVIVGVPLANKAYIYFGGETMNSTPDVVLMGEETLKEKFGWSVSGAGDVNSDGYDDVVVGAPYNSMFGYAGKICVYFGGSSMDATPDLILFGSARGGCFGYSVACAGDVNGDGYGDIIIGQPFNSSERDNYGEVSILFGGADSISGTTLVGKSKNDNFGASVSGAGDINKDGYDDVVIGASLKDLFGEVYIFQGGKNPDKEADVTFKGACERDFLGFSVCNGGDLNNDGYADVVAASVYNNGSWPGAAYVLFGGSNMDNVPDITYTRIWTMGSDHPKAVGCAGDINGDGIDDVIVGSYLDNIAANEAGAAFIYYGGLSPDTSADWALLGAAAGDHFGYSVSGAGDVNGDGYNEIIISAPHNDSGSRDAGRAYIYTLVNLSLGGILDPVITLGSKTVLSHPGVFSFGTMIAVDNFASTVNELLQAAEPSGMDEFGNEFVDIPMLAFAKSEGVLRITNLSITYQCDFRTPNFALPLNRYLKEHQGDAGPDGNITVPIRITSTSPGRVRLSGLEISRDLPPVQIRELEGIVLDEETAIVTLVDLYNYFEDDIDPDTKLSFAVVSSTNRSFVRLWISGNRYLSADAMTGESSANWTGTVEAVLACMDGWGQRTDSLPFTITVRNVEDPPVIISEPVRTGATGVLYCYNVRAVDGDGDPLEFSLLKAPEKMSIGPSSGNITWVPPHKGIYDVSVQVSDGKFFDSQDYNISVPNSPPRIIDEEAPQALLGANYTYAIPAADDDGDALSFALLTEMENMSLNSSTGVLSWRPMEIGEFPVTVNVSDGEANITHNFTIVVVRGNRAPLFKSRPVTEGVRYVPYRYDVRVEDPDGDQITLTLLSGPRNMTLDNSTGSLAWVPDETGNFSVRLLASDGRGGEALQEFVINVRDKVPPIVEFARPAEGQRVRGKISVEGRALRGSLDVVRVQVRVDAGVWADAVGNSSWSYLLDTTELTDGEHVLEARAFDGYDFSTAMKRTIVVDNAGTGGAGIKMYFGTGLVLVAVAILTVFLRWRILRTRSR